MYIDSLIRCKCLKSLAITQIGMRKEEEVKTHRRGSEVKDTNLASASNEGYGNFPGGMS